MKDLNWPEAIKRTYLLLWALAVILAIGDAGLWLIKYGYLVDDHSVIFMLVGPGAAAVYFASKWIFKGANKKTG